MTLRMSPKQQFWMEPGEKQRIAILGWGDFELTGEYLDYMPSLRWRPKVTLDPKKNEFRIVSPVLVRGNEVLFNLADLIPLIRAIRKPL